MTDETDKLRTTLEQLHGELGDVESADPEVRELLRSALGEIQLTLEGNPPAESDDASVSDRLSEAAKHYEETHPNLSGMLGGVIDALGRMGI